MRCSKMNAIRIRSRQTRCEYKRSNNLVFAAYNKSTPTTKIAPRYYGVRVIQSIELSVEALRL